MINKQLITRRFSRAVESYTVKRWHKSRLHTA